MKKRILSILLSMVLLIGIMPMGLFTTTASALSIENLNYYFDEDNNFHISFDGIKATNEYEILLRQHATREEKGGTWAYCIDTYNDNIKVTDESTNKGTISFTVSKEWFYNVTVPNTYSVFELQVYSWYTNSETLAWTTVEVNHPFEKRLDEINNAKLSGDGFFCVQW